MRGYVRATFETVGVPDTALPFLVEELESGRDAYVVAAAAKALRGSRVREPWIVQLLLKAIENIRYKDDVVTFDDYKPTWPSSRHITTALAEIFKTLEWLGPDAAIALPDLEAFAAGAESLPATTRAALAQAIAVVKVEKVTRKASCCAGPHIPIKHLQPIHHEHGMAGSSLPVGVRFEDQDGRNVTYGEVFTGQPTVVVFFYTRCNNPNKCSLTITKLAKLQHALGPAGLTGAVHTAAITYDPEFDIPSRLKAYGLNRGAIFDSDHCFLRAVTGFKTLTDYFELGVSYGQAAVNRHKIEAFILDNRGRIDASFQRLQWDVGELVKGAERLVRPG